MTTMKDFLGRGGCWMLAQNVLTLAVLGLGPLFRVEPSHRFHPAFGGTLLVIGALFGVLGVRALGRNRTPYPKPVAAGELVQTGVYGVVRHPLYTSLMALALGWSLLWSGWPALGAAGALILVLAGKARVEERWLRERFPAYAGYASRVRRFVPWLF